MDLRRGGLRLRISLDGRRIVITGASGGIGAVVASRLASNGAQLTLVGRNESRLEATAASLPSGEHHIQVLDVTDEQGWRRALRRLAPGGELHGLVAAAGILGPIGPIGTWEIEKFRHTIDVNLVGTLLPIVTLLDPLKRGRGSVVAFSGGGATSVLNRYDAYASSKAAVVRLTENLSSDLHSAGVRINCVAPGFVVTEMHRDTLDAGPDRVGVQYFERTRQALETESGDSAELSASLTSFLLSDASAGITGRLISARWDSWEDPHFLERLRQDRDFATLRRIDDQFFTSKPGA
jgi:NAD(P)-dependent dehydrogenase (short-subunit alcohol dehydrogenase family)